MPEINDMFPALDYDTLNKGLDFINFSLPGDEGSSGGNAFDDKFQDGIDTNLDMEVEINESEVPQDEKSWDKLTRSERINRVKQESPGMPIVSQIDLSVLRKVASQMNKKGMYKESGKIFKVAENFTKSITLNEQEVDGQHEENASVNLMVNQEGEPISINKTFSNNEEAMEFYHQFVLPGVEEIIQLEGSMKHFGLENEAFALRRFLRAVKLQIADKIPYTYQEIVTSFANKDAHELYDFLIGQEKRGQTVNSVYLKEIMEKKNLRVSWKDIDTILKNF